MTAEPSIFREVIGGHTIRISQGIDSIKMMYQILLSE